MQGSTAGQTEKFSVNDRVEVVEECKATNGDTWTVSRTVLPTGTHGTIITVSSKQVLMLVDGWSEHVVVFEADYSKLRKDVPAKKPRTSPVPSAEGFSEKAMSRSTGSTEGVAGDPTMIRQFASHRDDPEYFDEILDDAIADDKFLAEMIDDIGADDSKFLTEMIEQTIAKDIGGDPPTSRLEHPQLKVLIPNPKVPETSGTGESTTSEEEVIKMAMEMSMQPDSGSPCT